MIVTYPYWLKIHPKSGRVVRNHYYWLVKLWYIHMWYNTEIHNFFQDILVGNKQYQGRVNTKLLPGENIIGRPLLLKLISDFFLSVCRTIVLPPSSWFLQISRYFLASFLDIFITVVKFSRSGQVRRPSDTSTTDAVWKVFPPELVGSLA